jgi:hypothetical protein
LQYEKALKLLDSGVRQNDDKLILSFGGSQSDISRLYRLFWVVGGVAVLLVAAKSRLLDQALSRLIKWALKKWTTLDIHDYINLLNLSGEYMVTEIQVREQKRCRAEQERSESTHKRKRESK